MAAGKSSLGIKFRGIARYLWIALAVLMTGMLVDAWYRPPPEGFVPYARKIILILILSFVFSPFISTGIVSLVGWFTQDDPESSEKDQQQR